MLPFREESKQALFRSKREATASGMECRAHYLKASSLLCPYFRHFLIVLVSSDDDAPLKSLSEVDTAVRVSVRRNDVVR